VVGAVGYQKNWNGMEEVMREAYISFIAVHPGYRGQNIARLLDRALAQKLGPGGMTHVNVTPWSTNPGAYRRYKHLGYVGVKTLKDHRGPGVDTIYFRKSLK